MSEKDLYIVGFIAVYPPNDLADRTNTTTVDPSRVRWFMESPSIHFNIEDAKKDFKEFAKKNKIKNYCFLENK